MNFLAHIFLSQNIPELKIGNFIGDFVKGKEIDKYPAGIQAGIKLHRKIDNYTDQHPVVLKSKIRLRPGFHHYSPVIVDVFYDHFLAKNWENFHSTPLLDYTLDFYKLTDQYDKWIPEKTKNMLIYMRQDNWLYNYQYIEGIDRALSGMSRRTQFKSNMELASLELEKHYDLFYTEFSLFFPDLQNLSKNYIESL